MDHRYGFPSPQPYHDFMQIPPLSGPEHLGTTLAEFSTSSLHHATHSFPNSPISPTRDCLSHQQSQYSHHTYDGFDSIMSPTKGDCGTNEEDNYMSSSQSRRKAQRKAQNRAAQQAFRKRKEMHVKELETRLASLEAAQQQVLDENEHLEKNLHKILAENEMLRATSQGSSNIHYALEEPATFNTAEFYANLLPIKPSKKSSKKSSRTIMAKDGECLLNADAAWELIINHRLFKKGLVDVGDVSERLKHCAQYGNHRLLLPERSIIAAIEQSVASRTDDLL